MRYGYSDAYISEVLPMDLGWNYYFDGDYFQPESVQEVAKRRSVVTEVLESSSTENVSLSDYQKFTELDWLNPHGHFTTVLKMEEHLLGEHTEFVEANTELTIRQRRQNKLNETEDSHEVVSELGDILWFLNAQATNGSVSFQDAWNFRLYRDRMNLTEDSARIKSVDDLIMKGYQPRMGVFELDDDPAVDLLFAAGFVCVGTKIIIEEHSEAGKYVELARTSIDIKKESMGLWLTHALGIITLHAQKNGASLSEVMQENMKKITLRAERKNLSKKASRQADEL